MTGRATSNSAAETYVGDFIGSSVTHIVRVGFDPRPGWGRAVCGTKGHMPEAKDSPVVTCRRCSAWAKKNRPENMMDASA